jgi:hypothetical protein
MRPFPRLALVWGICGEAQDMQSPHFLRGLLTARQLAKLLPLDLNEDTIYKYAKAGTIPSVVVGSDVYFDPKQIAGWIRNLLKSSDELAK